MLEQNIPMDASDEDSLNRLANIGQELYKNNLEYLKHFIQHKIEPYKHNI
jgi:hypothetical protein